MKVRKELLATRLLTIENLARLLSDISTSPVKHEADGEALNALRTQGLLAAYSDPSRGIFPMSLNHQKELAVRVLGSYDALNTLRLKALAALKKAPDSLSLHPSRGSKAELQAKLAQALATSEVLRCDLFVLQRAYDLRCAQARAYAESAGQSTVDKCKREQKEIDATFSLLRIAVQPKVSHIDVARDARKNR